MLIEVASCVWGILWIYSAQTLAGNTFVAGTNTMGALVKVQMQNKILLFSLCC